MQMNVGVQIKPANAMAWISLSQKEKKMAI